MSYARWVRGGVGVDDTPPPGSLVSLNLKVGDVVKCLHAPGEYRWFFTPGVSYTVYWDSDDEELCLNGVPMHCWHEVTHEFERVS